MRRKDHDDRDLTPTGHSYLRFSSKKQKKGDSVRRQTEDTVAGESPASWCDRHGVRLSQKSYRDMGLSAWDGSNVRKGDLSLFLEAVESGLVRPGDYLLVEKIDRISRQGVEEGLDTIKKILKAGVKIVTLMNGRVYDRDCLRGLMKGLLELQIALEQAKEFSDTLSKRVSSAWEGKRKRAAEEGTIATACVPPWLEVAGEGGSRRAVVVSDKADVVRRIFSLAIEGYGLSRITRLLIDEEVPPITRRAAWARTSVRRILTDRSVLGEFRPRHGPRQGRKPTGEVVEDYYPAVIDAATFHRANAALVGRKDAKKGRDSKRFNLFSGLLKDAGTGASYVARWRVEAGGGHQVLVSAAKTGPGLSFPYGDLERAVIALLKEVDPSELLPPAPGGTDRVRELSGELAAVLARLEQLEADRATCEPDELPSVKRSIRVCLDRKKDVAGRLADAKREADCPTSEAWGEFTSLLEALDAARDRPAAMLRLRAVLRRVVCSARMLVVPRVRDRLAALQFRFHGTDAVRSYLVFHRPPRSNQFGRKEGVCRAKSYAADGSPLDLRVPEDVARLAAELEKLEKLDL